VPLLVLFGETQKPSKNTQSPLVGCGYPTGKTFKNLSISFSSDICPSSNEDFQVII